jgi:hypothetical protein
MYQIGIIQQILSKSLPENECSRRNLVYLFRILKEIIRQDVADAWAKQSYASTSLFQGDDSMDVGREVTRCHRNFLIAVFGVRVSGNKGLP